MFEKAKLALRLRNAAFDSEITVLIAAAKADLQLAGIEIKEGNEAGYPLFEQAIILYCKGHFGYINDADKFIKAYESIKCALAFAGD